MRLIANVPLRGIADSTKRVSAPPATAPQPGSDQNGNVFPGNPILKTVSDTVWYGEDFTDLIGSGSSISPYGEAGVFPETIDTTAQVSAAAPAQALPSYVPYSLGSVTPPEPHVVQDIMVFVPGPGELGEVGEAVSVYRKATTSYVGITKDLTTRQAAHGEKLVEIVGGLTRAQARGVEQAIIEQAGLTNLANKINSIALRNPIYQEAVQFGSELLKAIGFQWRW